VDIERIREHWDDQARKFGTQAQASWADLLLHKEIRTVCHYVPDRSVLLDAGCANGFSTIAVARSRTSMLHGIDYSREMIFQARKALATEPLSVQERITFSVGDVRKLPFCDDNFEIVLSKRCITNLNTRGFQDAALMEFHRILKRGGLLLLSEPTLDGLERLNQMRARFHLPELKAPWHNLYLDESRLLSVSRPYFELERVVNFSSTYYVGSRVLYPFLVGNNEKRIRHDFILNKIFLALPAVGPYGVQKLFVLRRR